VSLSPIGRNSRVKGSEMPIKLTARAVDKPWGRVDFPGLFPNPGGRKIGEIWFESLAGGDLPLLVKYIFTSERLSIQVHPNDAQAIPKGLPSGKQECWYILDCEPDATLGIGLIHAISEADMRAAIADGSIEQLLDWRLVKPGDFFFIPAGTVHAIGAGITLVEVQQNADVTYRLYDYGRPRELHLEQGLAVSRLTPYDRKPVNVAMGETQVLLPAGTAPFRLAMVSWQAGEEVRPDGSAECWFIPLRGNGSIGGQPFEPGECWLAEAPAAIAGGDPGTALIASFDRPVSA